MKLTLAKVQCSTLFTNDCPIPEDQIRNRKSAITKECMEESEEGLQINIRLGKT